MNILFDAFISYGRADSKVFATKLHNRLVEENLRIWFDQNDIPLGVDYQNQIDDGIEKAHNFLFIIAPHSVNSPYCLKEIVLALKRNKRIIPLLQVEQISWETWQQRNPTATPEEWEAYKAKGLHTSFQNMHPTISKINWVYFREGIDDFEIAFAGLISLIRRQADYVEQHTRFLAKALEWERHQKQTSCLLIGEERQEAEDWLKIRFKNQQPPCNPSDLHCEFITESIKNANNLMTQVFLSYADTDRSTMEQIRNSLRRESITVWTNKSDIQTGEAFQKAVDRGIEQADNVVYLLSPESVNSDYCQQEIDYSLSLNKRIIPVLVRETDLKQVPIVLRNLQYIDLTDNVKEEDYLLDESQLLRILYQDAAYYNEHKILLTKALKWQRQHDNPSILLRGYNLRSAQTWLKVAKQRTQHPPTLLQEEFINASLQQPPASSLDVFISYSRADSDFSRKLNDALQMQGKTTWFDQESIASGSDFEQEIKQGIKVSDNFLFIISPRSINSPYCADEVEYAASLNKRFVTVLHQDVNAADLHWELAKVQWIDFNQNERDFNANFNQLVRTLDTDREHVRSHSKWLQRAIEWNEKDRSADLLLRGSEFLVAESWLNAAQQQNKQPTAIDLQQEYIAASREAIEAAKKRDKRQVMILRSLLGLVSLGFLVSIGVGWMAMKSQQKAARGEIEALQESSEARFALGQPFDALYIALKAASKLKASVGEKTDPPLRAKVVTRLQQSIYSLKEVNRLEGHEGFISDVSFSPDSAAVATLGASGQTIATIGNDKTLKLWRQDGSLISSKTFDHSENLTEGGNFSPDGQIIATPTRDKKVKLWRRDGSLISTLQDQQGLLGDMIFSPNSQVIATTSRDGKAIKLWRRDGSFISMIKDKHKQNLGWLRDGGSRFSQDGQTLATANYDETAKLFKVKLWRQNGTLITTLKGHEQSVTDVSFSPDNQIIATASNDKTVKLWRPNGTLITTLEGHDKEVNLVKFSPDGRTIATASADETVKLWQRDGTRRITLKGHQGSINDLNFSPNGQTIATASNDKTVRLWRLDGTAIANLVGHNDWVKKVRFSPDGKMLVSLSDDATVKLWNPDNSLLTTIASDEVPAFFTNQNPAWGQILATTFKNGAVKLWKADGNGTPIATLMNKSDGKVDVKFFNQGQTLITTINKEKQFYGPVQLWKANGTPIATLIKKTPSKGSVSTSVSNNGQMIITTVADKNSYGPVQLWKANGTLIATLIKKTPSNSSVSANVSNDGQTIITTVVDENSYGPVQLWKANGTLIATLIKKTPSKGYFGASFSNYGQTIITTVADENSYGPVQLWKADGTLIATLIKKNQHKGYLYSYFSKDSKTLITTLYDQNEQSQGLMQLWKSDGTFITNLAEKSPESLDSSFSDDSRMIVTTVKDGPVKIWKTDGTLISTPLKKSKGYWGVMGFSPDHQTVALVNQRTIKLLSLDGTSVDIPTLHQGIISNIIFSPNNQMIASASWDNTVKLWKRDGTLISTFTGHKAGVTSLNFSADGKMLTSVDDKNTVIVRRLDGLTDLDELLEKSCQRMTVYLHTSPNLEKSDRHLCDGIKTQK